jgi:hypothetical protein
MDHHSSVRSIAARLVGLPPAPAQPADPIRGATYRPLIVGAAILRRAADADRWSVPVSRDGRLRPLAPASRAGVVARLRALRAAGFPARIAASLVTPEDMTPGLLRRRRCARPAVAFYGWALLYQLPPMRGVAWVDPHEEFAELPAFYESPLELIDRAEFLADRGVTTRPLAVIAQAGDFTGDNRDGPSEVLPATAGNRLEDLDWLP